jgi:hypothetical protein
VDIYAPATWVLHSSVSPVLAKAFRSPESSTPCSVSAFQHTPQSKTIYTSPVHPSADCPSLQESVPDAPAITAVVVRNLCAAILTASHLPAFDIKGSGSMSRWRCLCGIVSGRNHEMDVTTSE